MSDSLIFFYYYFDLTYIEGYIWHSGDDSSCHFFHLKFSEKISEKIEREYFTILHQTRAPNPLILFLLL